jgi:hypothetical protein
VYKEVIVIEDFSQLATVAIMTAISLMALFLVWNLIVRSRRSKGFKSGEALEAIMDAKLDEGERRATILSEQIEQQVKTFLEADGTTMDIKLDFATAADGSLEIWIDNERYLEVDDIPNEKIRSAIRQAVEDFNQ